MINHGVIPGKLPTDWIAGTIQHEVRNPTANWYKYLVVGEHQKFNGVDVMGCVSFACSSTEEIQLKQQLGVEVNRSDRFLAKVSGTTEQGNWVSKVLDTRKKQGFVPEHRWTTPPPPVTFSGYYADIPQPILVEGLANVPQSDLQYEYIPEHDRATIKYHLQHAPLMVTIPGHEVTGFALDDNGKDMWVLDDYIFNVDPAQPFVRKIKLSSITDIYKAVFTVRRNMIGYKVVGNPTVYVELDGKLVPVADWLAFVALGGSTGSVVELSQEQFAKFTIINSVLFKLK